jgi:hypothetical protein
MSAPRNASAPKSRPTLVRAAASPDADAVSTDAGGAPRYRARPRLRPTTLEWMILLGATAWVVVVLLLRWPALLHAQFNSNSNIDSAFFAFAGQAVRDGGVPYLAFWDHKPPLIYLINALALTVSGGAVWGVWLATVAALLAALGIAVAAWRRTLGAVAAVIAAVWLAFSVDVVAPFNLTEVYAMPAQAAAVLIMAQWSTRRGPVLLPALGIGALAGIAFMLRPNLIGAPAAVAMTMVLVLLLARRAREVPVMFAGLLAGAALIVGPILLWLGSAGALGAFWDQVFNYNFVYTAASLRSRIRSAFEGLTMTTLYGTLLLPLAGWFVGVQRLRSLRRDAAHAPLMILCVLWAPLELGLAALPGRSYWHYFATLLLPFASLAALAISHVFAMADRALPVEGAERWRRRATVILCAGIGIIPVGRALFEVRDGGLRSIRADQVHLTAQYIRAHSAPNAPLLVWGHASDVYLFADRRPASRFVYPLALLTPGYADSTLVAGFLDELRASAPPFIIDATPNTTRSEALIPSLKSWNPRWRYPETGVAWWTMTPAMRAVYDYVRANYVVSRSIGPYRWVVYQRVGSPLQR